MIEPISENTGITIGLACAFVLGLVTAAIRFHAYLRTQFETANRISREQFEAVNKHMTANLALLSGDIHELRHEVARLRESQVRAVTRDELRLIFDRLKQLNGNLVCFDLDAVFRRDA